MEKFDDSKNKNDCNEINEDQSDLPYIFQKSQKIFMTEEITKIIQNKTIDSDNFHDKNFYFDRAIMNEKFQFFLIYSEYDIWIFNNLSKIFKLKETFSDSDCFYNLGNERIEISKVKFSVENDLIIIFYKDKSISLYEIKIDESKNLKFNKVQISSEIKFENGIEDCIILQFMNSRYLISINKNGELMLDILELIESKLIYKHNKRYNINKADFNTENFLISQILSYESQGKIYFICKCSNKLNIDYFKGKTTFNGCYDSLLRFELKFNKIDYDKEDIKLKFQVFKLSELINQGRDYSSIQNFEVLCFEEKTFLSLVYYENKNDNVKTKKMIKDNEFILLDDDIITLESYLDAETRHIDMIKKDLNINFAFIDLDVIDVPHIQNSKFLKKNFTNFPLYDENNNYSYHKKFSFGYVKSEKILIIYSNYKCDELIYFQLDFENKDEIIKELYFDDDKIISLPKEYRISNKNETDRFSSISSCHVFNWSFDGREVNSEVLFKSSSKAACICILIILSNDGSLNFYDLLDINEEKNKLDQSKGYKLCMNKQEIKEVIKLSEKLSENINIIKKNKNEMCVLERIEIIKQTKKFSDLKVTFSKDFDKIEAIRMTKINEIIRYAKEINEFSNNEYLSKLDENYKNNSKNSIKTLTVKAGILPQIESYLEIKSIEIFRKFDIISICISNSIDNIINAKYEKITNNMSFNELYQYSSTGKNINLNAIYLSINDLLLNCPRNSIEKYIENILKNNSEIVNLRESYLEINNNLSGLKTCLQSKSMNNILKLIMNQLKDNKKLSLTADLSTKIEKIIKKISIIKKGIVPTLELEFVREDNNSNNKIVKFCNLIRDLENIMERINTNKNILMEKDSKTSKNEIHSKHSIQKIDEFEERKNNDSNINSKVPNKGGFMFNLNDQIKNQIINKESKENKENNLNESRIKGNIENETIKRNQTTNNKHFRFESNLPSSIKQLNSTFDNFNNEMSNKKTTIFTLGNNTIDFSGNKENKDFIQFNDFEENIKFEESPMKQNLKSNSITNSNSNGKLSNNKNVLNQDDINNTDIINKINENINEKNEKNEKNDSKIGNSNDKNELISLESDFNKITLLDECKSLIVKVMKEINIITDNEDREIVNNYNKDLNDLKTDFKNHKDIGSKRGFNFDLKRNDIFGSTKDMQNRNQSSFNGYYFDQNLSNDNDCIYKKIRDLYQKKGTNIYKVDRDMYYNNKKQEEKERFRKFLRAKDSKFEFKEESLFNLKNENKNLEGMNISSNTNKNVSNSNSFLNPFDQIAENNRKINFLDYKNIAVNKDLLDKKSKIAIPSGNKSMKVLNDKLKSNITFDFMKTYSKYEDELKKSKLQKKKENKEKENEIKKSKEFMVKECNDLKRDFDAINNNRLNNTNQLSNLMNKLNSNNQPNLNNNIGVNADANLGVNPNDNSSNRNINNINNISSNNNLSNNSNSNNNNNNNRISALSNNDSVINNEVIQSNSNLNSRINNNNPDVVSSNNNQNSIQVSNNNQLDNNIVNNDNVNNDNNSNVESSINNPVRRLENNFPNNESNLNNSNDENNRANSLNPSNSELIHVNNNNNNNTSVISNRSSNRDENSLIINNPRLEKRVTANFGTLNVDSERSNENQNQNQNNTDTNTNTNTNTNSNQDFFQPLKNLPPTISTNSGLPKHVGLQKPTLDNNSNNLTLLNVNLNDKKDNTTFNDRSGNNSIHNDNINTNNNQNNQNNVNKLNNEHKGIFVNSNIGTSPIKTVIFPNKRTENNSNQNVLSMNNNINQGIFKNTNNNNNTVSVLGGLTNNTNLQNNSGINLNSFGQTSNLQSNFNTGQNMQMQNVNLKGFGSGFGQNSNSNTNSSSSFQTFSNFTNNQGNGFNNFTNNNSGGFLNQNQNSNMNPNINMTNMMNQNQINPLNRNNNSNMNMNMNNMNSGLQIRKNNNDNLDFFN